MNTKDFFKELTYISYSANRDMFMSRESLVKIGLCDTETSWVFEGMYQEEIDKRRRQQDHRDFLAADEHYADTNSNLPKAPHVNMHDEMPDDLGPYAGSLD